ncbi:T6SS immunity protein Tdi1 domain-containing protein [Vibrio fluvialis]|nr:DUF1851 domain-containing protein [Vibrio fluvialis]ELF6482629.1 DUF1851 domain-containing protein [Vibrio fluvialis]ELG4659047.1 DUF1851 domain-containing protein [Vibrio fluvialis]
MVDKTKLPDFDGKSAYKGALRFHEQSLSNWEVEWGNMYGSLKPEFTLFATDVFGTAYGLLPDETVAIFWTETGELEPLRIEQEEFFSFILDDPESTINYGLYLSAVERLGQPKSSENFAFNLELALGGQLSVDNLSIMDSKKHFRVLAKIAHQINDIPLGHQVKSIVRE